MKSLISKILYSLGIELSRLSLTRLRKFSADFDYKFVQNNQFDLNSLVRIGGDEDGGYWFPKSQLPPQVLISPGIGMSISFDLEMARLGTNCVLLDKSVDLARLDIPSDLVAKVSVIKKNLGIVDDRETVTIESLLAGECQQTAGYALQMDIEGSEYLILSAFSEQEITRFGVILVEFHSVDKFFSNGFLGWQFEQVVGKLSRTHDMVYSQANIRGGFTRFLGYKVPHAIETTWLLKGLK